MRPITGNGRDRDEEITHVEFQKEFEYHFIDCDCKFLTPGILTECPSHKPKPSGVKVVIRRIQ